MVSSVHANAVNCVKGEIHNVLTVLRLNARWATRARFTKEIPLQAESLLIRSLKSLHTYLEAVDDLGDVDAVKYLEPFLSVVESPHTTGPMTGAALSSLHKFLLYGFMSPESPRAREGIDRLARSISNFHFEETDPESDEVVLMKLLELSALCLRCEVGRLLSDTRCWEIFQACYRISAQEHVSSLLGNTAGNTLAHIVLIVFSRPRAPPAMSPRSKAGKPGAKRGKPPAEPASPTASSGTEREAPQLLQHGGTAAADATGADSAAAAAAAGADLFGAGRDSGDEGDEEAEAQGGGAQQTAGAQQQQRSRRRRRRVRDASPADSGGAVAGAGGGPAGEQLELNVLVEVMRFLSTLTNPRKNSEETCILCLSLINIALEAGGSQLGQQAALVQVMQVDLCKHLLHCSQTEDMTILSLTLRVVFNLFNSIKDHLKVQLEVFITSIHLRILEGGGGGAHGGGATAAGASGAGGAVPTHPPEQRELVLESLLEFCREPTLMLDLYINYDCDVQCTNLFETVCNALSRASLPPSRADELNALNRLALECVLSVIESMAKRCCPPPTSSTPVPGQSPPPTSLSPLPPHYLKHFHSGSSMSLEDGGEAAAALGGGLSELESDSEVDGSQQAAYWLEQVRAHSAAAEVLLQRKRMKRRLALAAQRFNTDAKGWLGYAQELGLLLAPASAGSVARFLKTTPALDKAQLGEYLSKGPPDRYPFNGEVLKEYARLFDFRDTPFDEALRRFLKEFRLPGEAQCIDRLMEAFAKEYFRQCKGQHPFASADAAFILAFSVIMLNTDLHNPQIRDDKRMSKVAFVRNNRQINDGQDLPLPFLEAIYDSIAKNEIAVHRDHLTSMQEGAGPMDYALHWDGIMNRSRNVTLAAFTPATGRKSMQFSAGVHERDMFTSIAERALQAMGTVFERSQDDALVLKALHGLHCYGKVCTYFGMTDPFSALLVSLVRYGIVYMAEANAGLHPGPYPALLSTFGLPDVSDIEAIAIPATNAHSHRGLLALKSALELLRVQGAAAAAPAWGALCESLLGLCDLRALPPSLSDVDDFSDAAGVPLPPSAFATRCRNRAGGGRHSMSGIGGGGVTGGAGRRGLLGGLSSFLWGGGGGAGGDGALVDAAAQARGEAVAALQQVVATCHLEQLFPGSKDLPLDSAKLMLRALLGCRDPSAVSGGGLDATGAAAAAPAVAATFEGHAVLALELGSRVILANRHRVEVLWPLMHTHVERVLSSQAAVSRLPFLVERMVVTVLRSCIHLLDQSRAAAPPLLASLALLTHLPADILQPLGDRVATGLLTLMQANAAQLDAPQHWAVVAALLAAAAAAPQGRGAAWEAVAYLAERGPLTPHNVRPTFQLVVRFMEGDFEAGAAPPPPPGGGGGLPPQRPRDRSFTPAAMQALGTFVLTLTGGMSGSNGGGAGSGTGARGGAGGGESSRFLLSPPPPPPPLPEDGSLPPAHAPILTQMQADSLWETSLRLAAPLVAHPDAAVSRAAAACVHRLVHQSAITSPAVWHVVFTEVLLKLPIGPRGGGGGGGGDGEASEELCLRCCTLVSRAVLQNLPLLAALPGFNTIWLTLLALLGTNITASPPGAVIHETCQQIITNMIMVVAHAGAFDQWSPAAGKPRDLLEDTWKLVDPVCPTIRPLFLGRGGIGSVQSSPPATSAAAAPPPEDGGAAAGAAAAAEQQLEQAAASPGGAATADATAGGVAADAAAGGSVAPREGSAASGAAP